MNDVESEFYRTAVGYDEWDADVVNDRFVESEVYLIVEGGHEWVECRCGVCSVIDSVGLVDAMGDGMPTEDGEYRLRLHVVKYPGVPARSSDEWDVFVEVADPPGCLLGDTSEDCRRLRVRDDFRSAHQACGAALTEQEDDDA